MITVGIIGFGLSGRYLQTPFFLTNSAFRLKTVMTNSSDPRSIYPSLQIARSLDEILNDTEIDLVSICSPNETHYDYAKRCLLAKKNVLVEKPFTASIAQAQELIALAEKQGVVLTVFQNRRWDSDFLTVEKVIKSGVLGELLSYEAHFDRFKPILNVKKWKEVPSSMSGILYDLGSHLIDQAVHLFGKPQSISGQVFTQREHTEIDDAFNVYLDYGKLKVTLKSSLLAREETPKYILHGSKGSFVKSGLDLQEDHLKAGMMPNEAGFGKEPAETNGILNTEINGLAVRGIVETEAGNWSPLFQNLADAINKKHPLAIKLEDITEQINIINVIKGQG